MLLVAGSACGMPPADTAIDLVHDACAPLAVAITAPAPPTAVQEAGVAAGLALWRALGVAAPAEDPAAPGAPAGPEAPPAARLEVRFEPAAPPFHGLYDDEAGVVYINSGIEAPDALAIVIAHELGHAFGLPHVPRADRPSLMNPGNLAVPPTAEDRAALAALWGSCSRAPHAAR